ncbi:acyl-CoA dehydrogenase family protein (plasmid) [Halobaculum sp. CBA1158]|uniref:acyl-CoA dehydrogenase family protein n=1 Tax=Halobaculum sp. CBA1158 TaxID=2904243 RepID=UPI001F23561F|nr:acyl-CoA dehydrogenase family protein [Halobaculum sp. CBA1158]UIP01354.1 acyl-CoA dehydrogenase family protein [Halobaculum sp. CBA1158]
MSSSPIDYGRLDAGRECNYWAMDPTLRTAAARAYPDGEFEWAEPLLSSFGDACGHGIAERSDRIDRHPPELHTYDADGEVVNRVEYHPDQHESEHVVYGEFRLTHDAFHAPPGREEPASLTHTLAMQALLSYCDVGFCCPASMTTGAALVLDRADHDRGEYLRRLTSADPDEHVEGAMFLTEKQGGSDVGANEVTAERVAGDEYAIRGEKWFCSNVDAQGALVLARTPDAPAGTDGLSLFLVPHEVDGEPNAKLVRRLKDKLGTLSVPTGEIEFRGATGYLIGEEGDGFRLMAEMMNYERLTNATGAVGVMGRALLEAKVHAANREAFGSRLDEHALMRRDLAEMTVEYEGAATFAFEAARWYNAHERGEGDDRDGDRNGDDVDRAFKLMRLLVPIAKYRTARDSVGIASYCMEVLGGDGYVREHVTPRLLRDTQVLPIWEGASNVISLDVLRVLERERAHEAFVPYVADLLDVDDDRLADLAGEVDDAFGELQTALATLATEDAEYAQYHAKELANLIYDVTTAALLLDRADDALAGDDAEGSAGGGPDARPALVAEAFVAEHLRTEQARGIASGESPCDEHFDALARYASIDPAEVDLGASPAAADD